jgi:hypothetical protein
MFYIHRTDGNYEFFICHNDTLDVLDNSAMATWLEIEKSLGELSQDGTANLLEPIRGRDCFGIPHLGWGQRGACTTRASLSFRFWPHRRHCLPHQAAARCDGRGGGKGRDGRSRGRSGQRLRRRSGSGAFWPLGGVVAWSRNKAEG